MAEAAGDKRSRDAEWSPVQDLEIGPESELITPMSTQANPSTPEATRPKFQLTAEETHTNAIDILLHGREIGSLINDDGNVTDEMRELAALFVAAPDMLAALKGITELLADGSPFYLAKVGSPITNEEQKRIDRAFIAIDSAVAKARVRQ